MLVNYSGVIIGVRRIREFQTVQVIVEKYIAIVKMILRTLLVIAQNHKLFVRV